MVDDDSFNELIDVGLARDLVMAFWDRHQCGAETDGQVVGVHHIVLAVLRQAGGMERSVLEGNPVWPNLTPHANKTITEERAQCMNTRLLVCATSIAVLEDLIMMAHAWHCVCVCLNECT